MHSQMLKGVLEGCILYIISQEEVYGYELSTKLNQYGFTFVSEGSIYPLLLRMQKEKLIEGTLKTSNLGPKRKYYHLTEKGLEQLEVFKGSWDMVSTTVNRLLGGKEKNETR
ncbi:PadR family transcriptional regulator [Bacillus wiedmannii]|uniref:PadR family transcriptional regulator n=1 Tax=Bacillus wiedmannii TaxID=1890302 RepID=A0ABX5DQ73_9BACI|nr:PadR family transcriptional regulator [Bacillus wiedmannii]PRT36895.1 PadR family transcriptional regulator [Bacillus wiedmannii]